MNSEGKCKSCGASILWRKTTYGNLMPIDPEPCEDGNVVLVGDVAHVISGGRLFEEMLDGPRHKAHFATCPNSQKHRKPR